MEWYIWVVGIVILYVLFGTSIGKSATKIKPPETMSDFQLNLNYKIINQKDHMASDLMNKWMLDPSKTEKYNELEVKREIYSEQINALMAERHRRLGLTPQVEKPIANATVEADENHIDYLFKHLASEVKTGKVITKREHNDGAKNKFIKQIEAFSVLISIQDSCEEEDAKKRIMNTIKKTKVKLVKKGYPDKEAFEKSCELVIKKLETLYVH